MTVENLTNGAFRKSLLMYAVSIGVGTGIAFGVLKIVYMIPIAYLIVPGYAIAIILTKISTEEFVNVAWDSAGVTTGPVTVPLVLAMGLGFGNAVGAIEGFGILCMASIGPIISVLITGLWIQMKIKQRHEKEDKEQLGDVGVKVT
jgi:maltodextrin utilization protein YvdJ